MQFQMRKIMKSLCTSTYLRIQLKNSINHRNRLKLYKIESDPSV